MSTTASVTVCVADRVACSSRSGGDGGPDRLPPVSNPRWEGETATGVFKVFTFGTDELAVLLQDCTGREDALAHLDAE